MTSLSLLLTVYEALSCSLSHLTLPGALGSGWGKDYYLYIFSLVTKYFFSYLGGGVSLHGCSSKAQPLLLTLDKGYLLTATPPDLERGVAPLGPPAPAQPPLLGLGLLLSAAVQGKRNPSKTVGVARGIRGQTH